MNFNSQVSSAYILWLVMFRIIFLRTGWGQIFINDFIWILNLRPLTKNIIIFRYWIKDWFSSYLNNATENINEQQFLADTAQMSVRGECLDWEDGKWMKVQIYFDL